MYVKINMFSNFIRQYANLIIKRKKSPVELFGISFFETRGEKARERMTLYKFIIFVIIKIQ